MATVDGKLRCGDSGGKRADGSPCRQPLRGERTRCHQHPEAGEPVTGGRPRFDFTDEQVAEVEKLAGMLPLAKIADFFGIHEETIRRRFEDDERVLLAYLRGRAKLEAMMGNSVIQQGLAGDVSAAQFYLRTQAGWTDKQKHEVEHSGPGGGAIPHQLTVRFVKGNGDGNG